MRGWDSPARLSGMASTFTRMDESTLEDWVEIGAATAANQGRVADRLLELLESPVSYTHLTLPTS